MRRNKSGIFTAIEGFDERPEKARPSAFDGAKAHETHESTEPTEVTEAFEAVGKRRFCHAPAVLVLIVMTLMLVSRLLSDSLLLIPTEHLGAARLLSLVYLVAFPLPILLFFLLCGKRNRVPAIHRQKGTTRFIVCSFLLLIVCAMLTQSVRCYWFGAVRDSGNTLQKLGVGTSFAELLLCYAALPAVLEELLLRGTVLRFYQQKYGGLCAILASAVLFSLLHFSPEDFLSYFLSGLILGTVAYVGGSLLAVILMHFFNNLFSMYLENAIVKIATESNSVVLMIFVLTVIALFLLFCTLYELESYCRKRMHAQAPAHRMMNDADGEAVTDTTTDMPFRLIPTNKRLRDCLHDVFLSPCFIACILLFCTYGILA